MSSAAKRTWDTVAVPRLNELQKVHKSVRGSGPGRRWGTGQLNRSLFVALVAQFQVYCRDLHDEAIDVHVAAANPRQSGVLRKVMTEGRELDRRNPRRDALGSDFARLGVRLIPEIKATGIREARALDALDRLVDFRNAIAHGDETKLQAVQGTGDIAPTLRAYFRQRNSIERLVRTIDIAVATELAAVLGVARPW